MTTAVTKKSDPDLSVVSTDCPITLEDLRRVYAPNATEKEFLIYLDTIRATQLDPRKKEIYFVKYDANRPGAVITGYTSYLKRAERSGKLDGYEVQVQERDGRPVSATITIYRKDWQRPFVWTVTMAEESTGQSTWKTRPRFMLQKVAIAQGMRLAFPEDIGGLPYTQEELSTFDKDNAELAQRVMNDNTALLPKAEGVVVGTPPPPAGEPPAPDNEPPPQPEKKRKAKKIEPVAPPPQEESDGDEDDDDDEEKDEAAPQKETALDPNPDSPVLDEITRTKIISRFADLKISKELLESVLGCKADSWTIAHRAWLIERFHELDEGTLKGATAFARLSYS